MNEIQDFGTSLAPELRGPNLEWVNSNAIELAGLRGRLVILDFWTFCCINCIQILPTLRRIEDAFPSEVAVIGVHSPKFSAEQKLDNVSAAVSRYGIRHPVVHDADFSIWRAYQIRAWPTLVFISPNGVEIGRMYGEPDANALLANIENALAEWRASGVLRPQALTTQRAPVTRSRLRFPAKIKSAPGRDRAWVLADSGNNQIVLIDEFGQEQMRYGSGSSGLRDGSSRKACFNGPQGLAASIGSIFVADTGNHALRRIDRESGHVEALAGHGVRGPILGESTKTKTVALASPWDVELAAGLVIFANAGTHQLGAYDVSSREVSCFAGTGQESIDDGEARRSTLAQPSGLALSPDGKILYFIDSETSAVRQITLTGPPTVSTLVGTGLFDFGHANGRWPGALLQHPLGISANGKYVAVADSYNNSVRVLDLAQETISDLDSGDFICVDDVCVPLSEPAGLCYASTSELLVVDTNNHRVMSFNLALRQCRTWLA